MFPLTCLFFHKTHNINLQKSLVNPLFTEVFSTAERQFRCAVYSENLNNSNLKIYLNLYKYFKNAQFIKFKI